MPGRTATSTCSSSRPTGCRLTSYNYERVAEPLVACGLGYDVIPCSWSDLVRDRADPDSLVSRAVTEGRLIYRDRIFRMKERSKS